MATSAAVLAAIAQAVKASGVIVSLSPEEFQNLLARAGEALVVCATGGFIAANYQYLFSYKGLAFFTKSDEPLNLPSGVETIIAKKIWVP